MVTAATIYMALLGPEGLRRVAAQSHANTLELIEQLEKINGVKRTFSGPIFHEAALTLPTSATEVLLKLKEKDVLGGLNLQEYYPDIENTLLVCATETKTSADLQHYTELLAQSLS